MLENLVALFIFTFSTSITPGPNNVMLMTSGVNFGVRRSMPHLAGVSLGFIVMEAVGAFGFSGVFAALPWMRDAVTALGTLYLLYLAWRIAFTPVTRGMETRGVRAEGAPLGFWGAAAFQWVNPKGWVMMIGIVSVYVPLTGIFPVLAFSLVIGLLCSGAWVAGGAGMAQVLATPGRLRAFNVTMAILLVLSLVPAARELWQAVGAHVG